MPCTACKPRVETSPGARLCPLNFSAQSRYKKIVATFAPGIGFSFKSVWATAVFHI